jgi:hypothetical protein
VIVIVELNRVLSIVCNTASFLFPLSLARATCLLSLTAMLLQLPRYPGEQVVQAVVVGEIMHTRYVRLACCDNLLANTFIANFNPIYNLLHLSPHQNPPLRPNSYQPSTHLCRAHFGTCMTERHLCCHLRK